jgi:signal transduction histidine kinase
VHELRNFIFGLSGSLDAFHARFSGLDGAERYVSVMRASLARLNAFLDELADYGDPRTGAWAPLDLERTLREVAVRQGSRLADPGRLRLELHGPLPPVLGDPASLAGAFAHLIGLALGDPAATAPVTVQAAIAADPQAPESGPGLIEGSVRGLGPDLAGLDPARLFEPFYFRAAGFGRLALPVARRVLERHGGSLAAAPDPGGGIRMDFRLPAQP